MSKLEAQWQMSADEQLYNRVLVGLSLYHACIGDGVCIGGFVWA